VPIEVPDTRAFSEPQPRRRRAATTPAVVAESVAESVEELVEAAPEPSSAFRKPVRRRRPVISDVPGPADEPAAAAVVVADPRTVEPVEPAESSAFSRPVRRRPKSEAAPVPAPVPVPEVSLADVPATDIGAPEPVAEVAPSAPVPTAGRPVVEERRGTEGVADAQPEVTDTVVVRLGGTRYAVPMEAVAEVGRPPHVTRVPGVPAWIAGVANWRGRIMPVLDLRILLGAPSPDLGVTGRIMVLARDGVTLAFLAERVEGVVSLELEALEPVLLTLPRTTASVLSGQLTHPDGPIALLDLDTVFGLRTALPRVRRAG
jgi:purine-binding chemotaxis protein CheW